MRVNIYNHLNHPIGWIEDSGGQIRAYHLTKGYCGYYNKGTNITFTANGATYCYGDGAQCLVRDKERGYL